MLKDLLNESVKKTVKAYTVKPEKMDLNVEKGIKFYPSMHIDSEMLPEVKDWDVGEEYYVVMKVRQKSKSMEASDKGERCNGYFDIYEIAALEAPESKEDETKEKEMEMDHGDTKMKKMYGV